MRSIAPISFDENDIDSGALCAWKEARGEGLDGIRGVLHVLANRARRWYGAHSESIHHAVYARNQFSSMSVPNDPEFNLHPSPDDTVYAAARDLAYEIFRGEDEDITNGALYYENPKTAAGGWFKTHIIDDPAAHPETARIRHHVFYA